MRHDRVGQYIHWKICQHKALYAKDWYDHKKPQKVLETGSATILNNFSIGTDRAMQTNKPDITLKDHGEKNMSNRYKYFCQRI